MIRTKIYLKEKVDREKLRTALTAITDKDKTFTWKIEEPYLFVFSSTKDLAYKRGLWLIHKVDVLRENNSGFEVR